MRRFPLESTLITYIAVTLLITFIFLNHPENVRFSSDTVYLPAIFSNVFIHGHSFSSWYFTPAPYFFPDMLIFFIIQVFFRNIFYAFLVYAVVQNLLFLYLMTKIIYEVTRNKATVLLTHIVFLLVLVLIHSENIKGFNIALLSAHHFGTMINGLIFIYLAILHSKNARNSILFFLFLIALLGTASDLLFLIQFVFPVIASLVLSRLCKIQIIPLSRKLFLMLFVGMLIGFSVKYFLHIGVGSHNILGHKKTFVEISYKISSIFSEAFLKSPVITLFSGIFYLALIAKVVLSIFFSNISKLLSKEQNLEIFLSIFILVSVVSTWGSAVINSLVVDRYMLNVFWFPVIFFWVLFRINLNAKMLVAALYLISIVTVYTKASFNLPDEKAIFPELVRCVDTQVKQYNAMHQEKIKYGIATYWQEKLVTVFSKEGLIIAQYDPNLHPRKWITTTENYREKYDFAIISNAPGYMLDVDLIKQINGAPFLTFKCDDHITLLIYGKNKLRVLQKES